MAHVIIIGAGTGGLPAAYDIKAELGPQHKVTVIHNAEYFQFVPSNPWVAVGWRTRADITLPLAPALANKGIDFIASAVTEIKPDENQVTLQNGTSLNYDFLVIATGPETGLRRNPRFRSRRPHQFRVRPRSCRTRLRKLAEVHRRPRPGRGRIGTGRVVFRPGL